MTRGYRWVLFVLGWMLFCGTLAWWWLPAYQGSSLSEPQIAWQLPALPQSQIDVAYRSLLERSAWGAGGVSVGEEAAGNVTWQLRGLVQQGGELYALIETGGKVRRYARGETLPDGQRLTRIEPDAVVFEAGKETGRRSLYGL